MTGCGSDTTGEPQDSASPTTESHAVAAPQQDDSPAESDEETVFTSAENPPLMPEVLVPGSWLRPIEENENFFAPPKVNLTVQETEGPKTIHENVRLLGFAVSLEDPSIRKAILKIGRAMYFLAPGEQEEGVKVVGMTRYTVHLERDGERWSLALHEQPMVNAPVIPDVAARTTRSTRTGGASGRPSSGTQTQSSAATAPPGMPEMPEMLKLPGMGEGENGLPGMPELGQDGMPQLPGMGEDGMPQMPGMDGSGGGLPGMDGSGGMPQMPGMDGSGGGAGGLPEMPGMGGGAGGGAPQMPSMGGGGAGGGLPGGLPGGP
ncbi:MAG: hypothetical protein D6753_16515 [Planctomycetota bacterium]|nr:MAG: hypothetical protein D6753_16515 [Planctomycetota bacterium]